jgi:hypothetical protein
MIDADDFSQKLNKHSAAVAKVNALNKGVVSMRFQPQASPMSWSRPTARAARIEFQE